MLDLVDFFSDIRYNAKYWNFDRIENSALIACVKNKQGINFNK